MLGFSESAPDFFGYTKNEFSAMETINHIMPQALSAKHDHFIMRLVESGKTKIIRKYRMAVACTKDGFIFPVNVYVNYFFHVTNDFCFSGLLLKLMSKSYFLVLDHLGFLHGYSRNFF